MSDGVGRKQSLAVVSELRTRFDRRAKAWSAWRSAADEVWATWDEVCTAPEDARRAMYDQHVKALEDERLAACELAAYCCDLVLGRAA